MGNIDRLVSFLPHEHLDLSHAYPPDELGNNSLAGAEGDGVGHVAQVWFEPWGDVDSSQLSLEVGDFEATSNELVVELLLSGAAGIELLAGGEGSAVDGGNEAIGDGVDCLVDIQMRVQEDFSGLR